MIEFFQQLTNGLAVGGIYALIALGYTMVYGVLKLINFAHGDLFTLGAYLGMTFLVSFALSGQVGPAPAVIIMVLMVMGCVALSGYLLERVAYRPLRNTPRLTAVVSALGASIFLQNAIMLFYGPNYEVYPDDLRVSASVNLLGLDIPVMRIIMFAASVFLMVILYLFTQKTKTGTAIRAVATDQAAARLMGIDVNRIISLVFMIGPALGGAAGVLLGLYYGQIRYDMGTMYGLKAFIAAIIGGIGNIPGAMLGGILLGVLEAMGAAYIAPAWKDALAFLILIIILIFRPTGILGEKTAEKI
ncbi:MAG: branched-chain amino acid ABC transporter permease [Deltaproteobacteria bacterium]|jgi:branched-chain amino acid transport system permease protein|nr:branched-chain amino acid ABC transporter permease [Deltaproteobacteria bacterium]